MAAPAQHAPPRSLVVLMPLLMLLAAGGCATHVSIPAWQKSVTRYIREEGNGDANVLRDMTWKDDHKGFGMISRSYPKESTDAIGILLGRRHAGDRGWFVFLVGLVHHYKVQDIRLAALSAEGETYHWAVSRHDRNTVRTYRTWRYNLGRQRFPDRRKPPVQYLGFPGDDDVFELDLSDDGRLTVTHPASGASWSVMLPAPATPRSPQLERPPATTAPVAVLSAR